MAQFYKVLAQSCPASGVLTDLYTVPNDTQAICSTITICNQGPASYYNIAVRPTGESIDNKHYIAYNASINNYDTTFLTVGLSLSSGDIISVQPYNSGISFNIYGVELT